MFLVDCDSKRVGTRYQRGRSYLFNVLFLWRHRLLTFTCTHRFHSFRYPLLHPKLSRPLGTFCTVLIKNNRIPNIRSHIAVAIAVARPPWAVPEVERMTLLHTRRGRPSDAGTANDGSVSDDEEVPLFAFERRTGNLISYVCMFV
jgi:hypothetical protein